MDKHITAIFVGIITASLILCMVLAHKEPISTCYAYIRDTNGNIHVMSGVRSNE